LVVNVPLATDPHAVVTVCPETLNVGGGQGVAARARPGSATAAKPPDAIRKSLRFIVQCSNGKFQFEPKSCAEHHARAAPQG
jgi:hypothetical protein